VIHSSYPIVRIATFGVLIVALLLAGCGRKGPLDLPPIDAVQQQGQGTDQSGAAASQPRSSGPIEYNVDGRPLAPRGQKKKLPGDVLLD